MTLLLLYLLPLRWCVMAAISSVLCINQHFIKVIKELGDSSHRDPPLVTNNNKPSKKKLKEFKDMVVMIRLRARPFILCKGQFHWKILKSMGNF